MRHQATQNACSIDTLAGDHENTALILSGGIVNEVDKAPLRLCSGEAVKIKARFYCQLALGQAAAR